MKRKGRYDERELWQASEKSTYRKKRKAEHSKISKFQVWMETAASASGSSSMPFLMIDIDLIHQQRWLTHKSSEHLCLLNYSASHSILSRAPGPSKSELKKRAKALEKEKKAAEKAAKQQELAQQQAAADVVRCLPLNL
jgi:hypothetical protein